MNEETDNTNYEYELEEWESGTLITPAKVTIDDIDYPVTPAVYSGNTPITPERLETMNQGIKRLYEEGAISKDIYIGSEEDAPEESKIVIKPNENTYDELKYRDPNTRLLKNINLPSTGEGGIVNVDSFPIGSILEFDGTEEEIPTGYEKVQAFEDNAIYSEEEKVVGSWFGKPLYGKTYVAPIESSTSSIKSIDIEPNIANVDFIWIDHSHSFFLTKTNNNFNYTFNLGFRDGGTNAQRLECYFRNNDRVIYVIDSYGMKAGNAYVTFLYTKTTD